MWHAQCGFAAHLFAVYFHPQVLLFTRSPVNGTWSERHRSYVIRQDRLPGFVDGHWNLNSGGRGAADGGVEDHGIPQHVLNFVAYVPPRDQSPLRFLSPGKQRKMARASSVPDPSASPTPQAAETFVVSSWGAVHVVNQRAEDAEESCDDHSALPLTLHEGERLARALVSSLRSLLLHGAVEQGRGLHYEHPAGTAASEAPGGEAPRIMVAMDVGSSTEAGFADWELDALMRRRAAQAAAAAAKVMSIGGGRGAARPLTPPRRCRCLMVCRGWWCSCQTSRCRM